MRMFSKLLEHKPWTGTNPTFEDPDDIHAAILWGNEIMKAFRSNLQLTAKVAGVAAVSPPSLAPHNLRS